MDEGLPKRGDPVIKSPEEQTVKDEWFKAYVEGNATSPQTHFAISIYLACEVLKKPKIDMEAFAYSELSEEQVSRIGEIMSRIHARKNIPHATADQFHNFKNPDSVKTVSRERILKLWTDARDTLIRYLANLVPPSQGRKIDWLNNFFNSEENAEKSERLIRLLNYVREAFKTPEIQKLFAELRQIAADLSGQNHDVEGTALQNDLEGKVIEFLRNKGLNLRDYNTLRILSEFGIEDTSSPSYE